jgi:hypothetical protein
MHSWMVADPRADGTKVAYVSPRGPLFCAGQLRRIPGQSRAGDSMPAVFVARFANGRSTVTDGTGFRFASDLPVNRPGLKGSVG